MVEVELLAISAKLDLSPKPNRFYSNFQKYKMGKKIPPF